MNGSALRIFANWSTLVVVMMATASCSQQDPELVTFYRREARQLRNCQIFIDTIYDDKLPSGRPRRTAFMQTACDIPESSTTEQWWGSGPKPPGFSLDVGDCMPIDGTYYCLEDVKHMISATFRATYLKPEHPKGNLRRIR